MRISLKWKLSSLGGGGGGEEPLKKMFDRAVDEARKQLHNSLPTPSHQCRHLKKLIMKNRAGGAGEANAG